MTAEIDEFVAGILGKECWAVIAGPGAGSVVDFYFGSKKKRSRPLTNPMLSADERMFEGERSIVVYSAWRVESSDKILSTSQNTDQHGIDLEHLVRVKNSRVDRIEFVSRHYDLRIGFSNGLTFTAFCDLATGSDEDSNYVMFSEKASIAIAPTGRVIVESRRL